MAEIVYAFGSSHGPLLALAPELWDLRAEADKRRTDLAFKDGTYTFQELLDLRRSNYLSDQNRIEATRFGRVPGHGTDIEQRKAVRFKAKFARCRDAGVAARLRPNDDK